MTEKQQGHEPIEQDRINEAQRHDANGKSKNGHCDTNHGALEERIEELHEQVEDVVEALIDLEEFAREHGGKKCPRARQYRIRVDKKKYVVDEAEMTGREILEVAGKTPPDRYLLQQKFSGGESKPVKLDEIVEFRTPGIERFMTLPLDQTEGGR